MQKKDLKKIYRIVDANFNRAKEGLRVCEDISRFILNADGPTRQFKIIRHKLTKILSAIQTSESVILRTRDIEHDVGKRSLSIECRRKNVKDVFYANSQRVKESTRVLEEFVKLVNRRLALELKKIRYQFYFLERKMADKL